MIRREQDRLIVSGPVTLGNVATLMHEASSQLPGVRVIDLGEVSEIHSALLAAMLAWMREAQRHESPVAFARVPQGLLTIARLYGVDALLPMESGTA